MFQFDQIEYAHFCEFVTFASVFAWQQLLRQMYKTDIIYRYIDKIGTHFSKFEYGIKKFEMFN